VNAGKKMKRFLKKKKKMRMVARTVASELEEEVKTASDSEGNVWEPNFGGLSRKPWLSSRNAGAAGVLSQPAVGRATLSL
jgi:hypothetical protein